MFMTFNSTAPTLGSWIRIPLEACVFPRFSVLCCPVYIEVLRRADPPYKESYEMSNVVPVFFN